MLMVRNKPKRNGTRSMTICEIEIEALNPPPKGYPTKPISMGDYLKQYRMIFGHSTFEMALELDVYESTIYKWEQGISNPNYLNTKKIIEFMGYDPRINNPLKIENYELT
ncbi:helix-turn-helix domain-containing protein [Flavobacteriaceae bacterium]|nr:helix-turn-helix domain-containing protein [Flavobacteriaceae bacterium]